nr:hypothetical protein [uncultured Brevundimonas sp.]
MNFSSLLVLSISIIQTADALPSQYQRERSERFARADSLQESESRRAGDPAHPAARSLPSAKAYMESMAGQADAAREAAPTSFIESASKQIIDNERCTIIIEGASGVARADGLLNGYRIVSTCEDYVIDLQENDYRQPLTQNVQVRIPDAAVNADFGPGKALARYYINDDGERTTVLSWYNGEQEVRLYAVGHSDVRVDVWNESLNRIMRQVVARRLASK